MTGFSMDAARARLAGVYRRFAQQEAAGRSALYEALALGVAEDADTLAFLLTLPEAKRQPNLLLAAARQVCGLASGWADFRRLLGADRDAVRACMLSHATQTNEPARCATLLPVLAGLPQPLALIEVGASAGLCLLPDHYAYDYGGGRFGPVGVEAPPVFACRAGGGPPIPSAMPRIVWRAGLDLNPLDAGDPAQAGWLETLVWPEQTGRLAQLRAAMRIAASVRPRVVRGNLLGDELAALCREAPRDATLVIFHTAVLAYVADARDRQEFATRVRSLCQYWIANEVPRVFPDIAAQAGAGPAGRFLLSVNGAPVAWTDPHGAAIDWIAA
jgi:hypothetical protein